jgi:broad specificity phosphatase PhoE
MGDQHKNVLQNPVYLVRHGEIESNRIGRYAGRSAEGLTTHGIAQTAELARVLSDFGIQGIRSSSVRRAWQTAMLIGEHMGLVVRKDERLDEMRLGPSEGLLESEVARDFPDPHKLWLTRPHELQLEGRETLCDVQRRISAAVFDASNEGRYLLVTHVAPIRVAILTAQGRSLQNYKRVDVPNGACFRIDVAAATVERVEVAPSPVRERRPSSEAISA